MMAADLNQKLVRLKSKRRAVEEAIKALLELDVAYREQRDIKRLTNRRPVQSAKSDQSREVA